MLAAQADQQLQGICKKTIFAQQENFACYFINRKMLKHELWNLLSGTGKTKQENLIQAIAGYLAAGKTAGEKTEVTKRTKQEETKLITEYVNLHHDWNFHVDQSRFIAEGAEQKVYLSKEGNDVIKLNSAVFYYNWSDYLNSLQIHNFFFPATQYTLRGFFNHEDALYAAVQQSYITADEITDVKKVKGFMENNGFILKKNNDYYCESLGLIAEDLHDENVLTKDGVLFFIDTVFYVTSNFYS